MNFPRKLFGSVEPEPEKEVAKHKLEAAAKTTSVPWANPIAAKPTALQVDKVDLPTERLLQGNRSFTLDLYQKLRQAEGNLFFSPYSISAALARTYATLPC